MGHNAIRWKYSTDKNGLAPIKIRITTGGKQKYIHTGIFVDEKSWDSVKEKVRPFHPQSEEFNRIILSKLLSSGKQTTDFFVIAQSFLSTQKNPNTYRSYLSKIEKLKLFSEKLKTENINDRFLDSYYSYLKGKGNKEGTVNCSIQAIKTILSHAEKEGTISAQTFSTKKRSKTTTKKDPLTAEEIGKIRQMEASGYLAEAKDLILLSFNLMGSRISDTLQLGPSNVHEDRLKYTMSKTNLQMDIKLTEEAKRIIEKRMEGRRFFPFLKDGEPQTLKQRTDSATVIVNRLLKVIAKRCGITKNLSTHVIRATWAQMALKKGIPSGYIQSSLGHTSLRTTEVYLKGINGGELDDSNLAVTTF